MLFDAVVYHRGPGHMLLAVWVQRRRVFLGLSIAAAAELAGLELSEWGALEQGWLPEDISTIRAIAATLEAGWRKSAWSPNWLAITNLPLHSLPRRLGPRPQAGHWRLYS